MENEVLTYFLTQGPFAALFVWLLFRSEKRNEKREGEYRTEIQSMREEMRNEREAWRQERDIWSETLRKFSEKYDVIIADLRDIKAKITGKG
jgi:hypothetical protein